MSNAKWRSVSPGFPCPACGKVDWCRLGGEVALCRRVEAGSISTKTDRSGGMFFVHPFRETGVERPGDIPRPATARAADPDVLHAAYSALLGRLSLSGDHRADLRRRGLTAEAIDLGMYRSLSGQGRAALARRLGDAFSDVLLRVPGFVRHRGQSGEYLTLAGPPGLLVPIRDVCGRVIALKVRSDKPRDKGPKYLILSSVKHGGPGPGNPAHVPVGTPKDAETVRLAEGELAAEVAYRLTGVATVAMPGANGWPAALEVALGMETCKVIRLAFDGDAARKPAVASALAVCARRVISEGRELEMERWDEADGKGIDDLLASGKSPDVLSGDDAAVAAGLSPGQNDGAARRLNKAIDAASPGRPESPNEERYPVIEGKLHRVTRTKAGPVITPLCNFDAGVVEDIRRDDGVEASSAFAIEGRLDTGEGLPRVEVPAAEYGAMNWVPLEWGARAVVYAGQGHKDHLRVAIQAAGGHPPALRTVYTHLGWREAGGRWLYLHAGGAVGPDGPADGAAVAPAAPQAGYVLPPPPAGDDRQATVRASLGLLGLGPDQLTFVLLAAAYRAALGPADFAVYLAGPTGTFKSQAAALVQQHFGAELDAHRLPANWSNTANANEALAFAAKDAVLVIDDFCPSGSSADVQRLHRDADRLFRGAGNGAGRGRMRADTSLRAGKPPRCLLLATGEDTPRGHSLQARLLVLNVAPGDFGQAAAANPALSRLQADAAAGRFAASMAGFVGWLAPQYGRVSAGLKSEEAVLREEARSAGQHARTPSAVAALAVGLKYLLDYAMSAGAVSEGEREELWSRGRAALLEAGRRQADGQAEEEPAGRFLRLLRAAVATGLCHLAGSDGAQPDGDPSRWGWHRDGAGPDGLRWRPRGVTVGWASGGEVYLEPSAAYRVARQAGDGLQVGEQTLRRRLNEGGHLESTDEARGKLTVRRTFQGERRDVLHVRWADEDPAADAAVDPAPAGGTVGAGPVGRSGRLGLSGKEDSGAGEVDPAEDMG